MDVLEFETKDNFANADIEGGYRRGYHQAVAAVVEAMESNPSLAISDLEAWVETKGMHWRKDLSLSKQIFAPPFVG